MPLKFREYVTYAIPERLAEKIFIGSRVKAKIKAITYSGVVAEITETPDYDPRRVVEIEDLEPFPPIRESELKFWKAISRYYMCSIGEVFKAASPYTLKPSEKLSAKKKSVEDEKEMEGVNKVEGINKVEGCNEVEGGSKASVANEIGSCRDGSSVKSACQFDDGYNVATESHIIHQDKINPLSESQQKAYSEIKDAFGKKKTVLLKGVTGSGKTEIYIHLIKECLDSGKNALYLLPEVAVSRQLSHRLETVFGDRMVIYHSKQTIAKRKRIIAELAAQRIPTDKTTDPATDFPAQESKLILGLRSSLFLPYPNLGLIIVDEEHDSSYKQTDPAPRYNGRDSAIILGQIFGADILLGSATPSYESEFNVLNHKYTQVLLSERYHESDDAEVAIVDMLKARRQRAVKGLFSLTLIKEIQKRLDAKEQVMVFRARRAYSPIVQCEECGEIPKCPHCNTRLTYHKFNGRLTCHYCGYSLKLGRCPSCGADAMKPVGAGTERVEEELRGMFPQARIARFDADTTGSRSEAEKILRSFSKGETDILVGTQMLSKGFDFANLTLVVVMQSESILAVNDFRGDEKAVQLLTQLKGRVGRREKAGMMLIQTSQAAHPVYQIINGTASGEASQLFTERKEFGFPPFVRIIELIIKDRYADRGRRTATEVERIIKETGITDYSGPIAPPIDKIQEENILHFVIRLQRNRSLEAVKKALFEKISKMEQNVIINVDPL